MELFYYTWYSPTMTGLVLAWFLLSQFISFSFVILLYSFSLDINNIYPLSSLCLSMQPVFLFFITSDVHQPLSQVRLSLVASLGLGQIMFLAGINATQDKVNACFFLFYFLYCFWLLIFLFLKKYQLKTKSVKLFLTIWQWIHRRSLKFRPHFWGFEQIYVSCD